MFADVFVKTCGGKTAEMIFDDLPSLEWLIALQRGKVLEAKMNEIISLDGAYSTTRCVVKAKPEVIAELIKQTAKPEDHFMSQIFLPAGENRKGEGGLRTNGYFKVGGLISAVPAPTKETCYLEQSEQSLNTSPLMVNPFPEAKPLITVVTVVYNGEQYLEETILSVINQTYENIEYIIIDGGSTDGTLDIIKKYEHTIDYWVSEKDRGIYDAMNKGIKVSLGESVSLINSDDFYTTELSISKFLENKKSAILYANCIYVSEEKDIIHVHKPLQGAMLAHPSVIIDLNVYKEKGLYDTQYRVYSDMNMILVKLASDEKQYIDLNLVTMRSGGISNTLDNSYIIEYCEALGFDSRVSKYKCFMKCFVKGQIKKYFLRIAGERFFNLVRKKLYKCYE